MTVVAIILAVLLVVTAAVLIHVAYKYGIYRGAFETQSQYCVPDQEPQISQEDIVKAQEVISQLAKRQAEDAQEPKAHARIGFRK